MERIEVDHKESPVKSKCKDGALQQCGQSGLQRRRGNGHHDDDRSRRHGRDGKGIRCAPKLGNGVRLELDGEGTEIGRRRYDGIVVVCE